MCNRPFSDVEEMNEALICNWNNCVTNADTVYVIGDLFFRTTVSAGKYLDRLKGRKHLIIGNHDKTWMQNTDVGKYFASVSHMEVINDGKRKITLCHYPMMAWDAMNRMGCMIHGHIHNNRNGDYWPLMQKHDHALNAGVDVNSFHPDTFEELVMNNQLFKAE
jgi:calcineurin-like phosphoesterase family protein